MCHRSDTDWSHTVLVSMRSVVVLGLLEAPLAIRERKSVVKLFNNIYQPDPEVCSQDPGFDQTTVRNSGDVNGQGI